MSLQMCDEETTFEVFSWTMKGYMLYIVGHHMMLWLYLQNSVPTWSSGTIVPLSGQDPPNDVSGEGSTIGFGLMKLEISQDGGSETTLCMVTFSTTINWFQGNQSVLFSDRKGDRSKSKTTEMPPMATRSKLWRNKIRQCQCQSNG